MINTLKQLLGFGPQTDYSEWLKRGAIILDVRTPGEYQSGHIKGSVNIPLQDLPARMNKIKKSVPVITCCASGARSASAARILKSNGFEEVSNGGSWSALEHQIRNAK